MKEFFLQGSNSFFNKRSYLKLASSLGLYQLFPLVKTAEKHGGESTYFNPTALRKAKIVYNFGLFECNRVKDCSM